MKKLMLIVAVIGLSLSAHAQLKFGIKGGLSTSDITPGELLRTSELSLNLKEAEYSLHFGAFIRAQAGVFFIQPEANFNSIKAEYQLEDLNNSLGSTVFSEKYRNLDVPVLIGLKFGPLRLGGGPVAHINLDSESDLNTDIPGVEEDFDKFTFGFQTGLGIDIWRLNFDLRYEGNFNTFGDHINIGGTSVAVGDKPNRILVSLGFTF